MKDKQIFHDFPTEIKALKDENVILRARGERRIIEIGKLGTDNDSLKFVNTLHLQELKRIRIINVELLEVCEEMMDAFTDYFPYSDEMSLALMNMASAIGNAKGDR